MTKTGLFQLFPRLSIYDKYGLCYKQEAGKIQLNGGIEPYFGWFVKIEMGGVFYPGKGVFRSSVKRMHYRIPRLRDE
jgi:hypothetical protein